MTAHTFTTEELAIRDVETTRRALEEASDWHDQQFLGFKQERDDFLKKHEQNRAPMKSTDHFLGLAITAENKMNYHFDSCKAILALQPALTGWKLVPDELPAENNKKAVKLALSVTVGNWPDYMNSLYRVMIGSLK